MSIVPQGEVPRESGGGPFLYPQLMTTNYTSWVIHVKAMIEDQGVWEAVEPAADAAVDEKKDKKARSHLFQALPEDLLMEVARKKTAKKVWDCLKTRLVGADHVKNVQLLTLKSDFNAMCMQEGESPDQYAGRINSMPVRIEQFYDLDKMLFKEVVGRLKAFEEHSSNRDQGGRGRDRGCDRGGRSGMSRNDKESGSGSSRRNKSHIKCFNCHKMRHYANGCNALKKKEEETHLTRADDTEPTLLLVV
ncbi:uncharacterized protein LOC133923076 [Phragmites australis]|uniref:uncharacterized protein LOC133923076 n=1 Tax=Phragmites australis TaxID=29695 RepID=UPI002D7A1044|nr:uncharacterized protein LOC133923076 [Phragmites australis]